jgi:hypothetical protein
MRISRQKHASPRFGKRVRRQEIQRRIERRGQYYNAHLVRCFNRGAGPMTFTQWLHSAERRAVYEK